jgi:prepilin-type N-terminal cleavage/methylation domain-containing protein
MKNTILNKKIDGFTLLELLVVMVIIGLLAGYVGPKYFEQIGKSETKTAKAQIDSLGKALDQYRIDTGHYPSTEQGLQALNKNQVMKINGLVLTSKKMYLTIHGINLMCMSHLESMGTMTYTLLVKMVSKAELKNLKM